MSGTRAINISPAHRAIVLDILRLHLPPGARVWVFGSRACSSLEDKQRVKPYSDLDLAIDVDRRLTLDEMAILTEAFSESDLPRKVDFVDWRAIDPRFAGIIESQRVELLSGGNESEQPQYSRP